MTCCRRSQDPSDVSNSAEQPGYGGMSEILWNTEQEIRQSGDAQEVWSGSQREVCKYLISITTAPLHSATAVALQCSVLLVPFCFSHLDFTSSPSDPSGLINQPSNPNWQNSQQHNIRCCPIDRSNRHHWMINIKGKIPKRGLNIGS